MTDSGNWYVLLSSLASEEEALELAPGVTLRRLQDPLTVFDLAAAGGVGFREWAVLEPFVLSCATEIESARDADVTPGYDALNRAWLATALLALRGHSDHLSLACSAYSWRQIAGHQKRTSSVFKQQLQEEGVEAAVHRSRRELPPFKGGLLDYHIRILTLPSACADPVSASDASWVRSHFEDANRLSASSERFRFALEASSDWRFQKDVRAALARIWAGIEAVFGISSELVFRISALAASMLEPRGEPRLARFRSVKTLYARRSKAVHGESMSEEKLISALGDSHELLVELVLKSIDLGRVPTKADLDRSLFF